MTETAAPAEDDAPLASHRVVELDALGPVPFAGLQLRQLGAHVTRVVPPDGRGLDLGFAPGTDPLHAGKTRRALDLKTDAGRAALHERLADADVLLEGFRPGVLERLGLAPDALLARHPRLVVGRLSGFGRTGPLAARAGHDINFLALSGALATIGPPERPVVPLNLVADFGAGGMQLVAGVLAALVRRGVTGRGGVVDTSILAATLALTPMLHAMRANGQWRDAREANLLDGGCPFYRVYATADARFVAVGALEPRFFRTLLAVIGLDAHVDAERQYDRTTWPALGNSLADAFAERTRDAWADAASTCDCCLSPVLDPDEALVHPQNVANGTTRAEPFPHPGTALAFDPRHP